LQGKASACLYSSKIGKKKKEKEKEKEKGKKFVSVTFPASSARIALP
jgi:hypothetical protein